MSHIQPSQQGFDRVSRVRAYRRLLAAHRAERTIRLVGCACGWRPASYLIDGQAAYEAHLADRLAAI